MSINPKEVYINDTEYEIINVIENKNEDKKLEKLTYLDVINLSWGIDKGDGIIEIIISWNTRIPFKKTITLKLINDSSFNCKLYEGERK